MNHKTKKDKEALRRLMELRRCNASSPIKSKKVYSRKNKHKCQSPLI